MKENTPYLNRDMLLIEEYFLRLKGNSLKGNTSSG